MNNFINKENIHEQPEQEFDDDVFVFPASYGQQRFWFLDQFEPGSPYYNIPMAVRLSGDLDKSILERVFSEIVRRHESLRTTFFFYDGKPVQVISPPKKFPIQFSDLRDLDIDRRDAQSSEIGFFEARYSFQLQTGPLIRIHLVQLQDSEYIIFLTMHHIISDGWSISILMRELFVLYENFSNGEASALQELTLQYADYAEWQSNYLKGEIFESQLSYWQNQLKDIPQVLEFPTDRPRQAVQTNAGSSITVKIPPSIIDKLANFTKTEGATLFMSLLAAFQILLSRYSNQDDICVGTPIANRTRAEIEQIIGLFINTLVIRSILDDTNSFRDVLSIVRRNSLDAYSHQDIPFEMLVDALRPQRDMSHSPLFQVMFILQNAQIQGKLITKSNLIMEQIDLDAGTSTFDITVSASEQRDGLSFSAEYNTDLFNRETISHFLYHFEVLLEGILHNPDQAISKLPLLSQNELEMILNEWNKNEIPFSQRDWTIQQLFEDQVNKSPDNIAIVVPETSHRKRESISFIDLNRRANILGHYLRKLGVGPENVVPICLDKSIDMIVAILGVLKAGGAYLPIDPLYPSDRISFMFLDSGANIVLSNDENKKNIPDIKANVLLLDTDWGKISQSTLDEKDSNPTQINNFHHLAYMIYTSGSTGKAKGVQLEHRNLVNAFLGWKNEYRLLEVNSHLQMANFSFDVFTGDLVRALCSGGKLVLCPREYLLDPEKLYALIVNEQIDCAEFVPAVLRLLIQYLESTGQNLSFFRLLICGSDSWFAEEYKEFQKYCGDNTRLINSFGLTEATIDSTFFEGSVSDLVNEQIVPIGRPFPNTQVYILDEYLQAVPIGVKGELYIGGEGVARGYWNRPDLNREKFIADPFSRSVDAGIKNKKLYRTGDAARYLYDGNVEFLGRLDYQVKIRGFRIETGEIEAVLRQYPGVKDAAVIAFTPKNPIGSTQPVIPVLVSYLTQDGQKELSPSSIRLFLNSRLPDYMVPSLTIIVDVIPLTPNGKIDRQALPEPDWSNREIGQEIILPRTPYEEIISTIWTQVLGIEKIGINENFFEIGGHSLLATQVASRIKTNFRIDLPLRVIFESPTIATLAEYVDAAKSRVLMKDSSSINKIDRIGTRFPLSFAQQRLWFLDKLEPNSSFYNLPETVKITGNLQFNFLEKALNEVVKRHETLRTLFIDTGGQPEQIILPELWIPISIEKLDEIPIHDRELRAIQLASEEVQKPFDLSIGPLLRAKILGVHPEEYIVILTMHHIIGDAWSSQVLIREIVTIYSSLVNGRKVVLPPITIQYADYAYWQRNWLKGEILDKEINYWIEQLSGLPPLLNLPIDNPRPTIQSFHGSYQPFELLAELSEKVRQVSTITGTTLYMTLLAAFQILLHRYSGQDLISVGTPIANRNRSEVEGLIGFFLNTIVIKGDFSEEISFENFLKQVRENTLSAYSHQDIPFETIVDALQPERNLSHSPLFQVMFTLQDSRTRKNDSIKNLTVGDVIINPVEVHSGTSKFDLTLFMLDEEARLSGAFEFNSDIFRSDTIQRMIGHYITLLGGIVADKTQMVWELPLLTVNERQIILREWNDTFYPINKDENVVFLFEEQVRKNPDSIALNEIQIINGKKCNIFLTYDELNRRANQLAHHLVKYGVGSEKMVGLYIKRSISMIMGILGILKAGGAYVPLDPTYPADRLKYMIEDSKSLVILTQNDLVETINLLNVYPHGELNKVICLDDWEMIQEEGCENLDTQIRGDQLAYVIYTSGSTGRPKGVMIEHNGLTNYLAWCLKEYPVDVGIGSPVHSSISFDLTVTSLFTPLISGKCVVLLPEEQGVESLSNLLMVEEGFSLIKITPAHLQVLGEQIGIEKTTGRTHAFIIGGENLTKEHISMWQVGSPKTQFVNEYGPTETVVGCCVYWANNDGQHHGVIPIGRPIINTQLYVLDHHGQPVPVGVSGELYIGGQGVGRGYLNRDDLTKEKFVPDLFGGMPGARLYRTGDLVKYLPDGNLVCLGRIDFQVKIRGFRVELGEIEAELSRFPNVKDVCVWTYDDGISKLLVAYFVLSDGNKGYRLDENQMRVFLRETLPEYMIPGIFIQLDNLPLTANGKVDRQALPPPNLDSPSFRSDFVAPRTPEEELVLSVWTSVLSSAKISIKDNFFEVGGHSLLATQITSRLKSSFGFDIPLRYIFEFPTIELLANKLSSDRNDTFGIKVTPIEVIDRSGIIPLSFSQQRLWFLDQLDPGKSYYNIPAVVRFKGILDTIALEKGINQIILRHEVLRTTFKQIYNSSSRENTVIQVIKPFNYDVLPVLDMTYLDKNNRDEFMMEWLHVEIKKPFDLSSGPVMRCKLGKLDTDDYIFVVTTHHIVTDDWSFGIFINELAILYSNFISSSDAKYVLPALPIQYADFSAWQRSWLTDDTLRIQIDFWKEALENTSFMLEIPTDRPRPPVQTYRGQVFSNSLDEYMSSKIRNLLKEAHSTLFMVLMAAFQTLLYRYSSQETFLIGTPIANRTRLETEKLIGFFVNTLVIRADINSDLSFRQLINQIRNFSLSAYAHQDLPFEMLVDQIQTDRDLSHSPLFQVMFVLQNSPRKPLSIKTDLVIDLIDIYDAVARYDITLTVVEDEDRINFSFDYNADLFTDETIKYMAQHFIRIIESATDDPDILISQIKLLDGEEEQKILYSWNDSENEFPQELCAHQLFEIQADRHPDQIALIYSGEVRKEFTYREIEERSNQLAQYLCLSGIGPESLVAICVERSELILVSLLGVLKCGGAYLPIDPEYPKDRIEFMLKDSQPSVILTQERLLDQLSFNDFKYILLDRDKDQINKQQVIRVEKSVQSDNMAYVIYTSGSTGKPKGVILQHKGLVNLVLGQTSAFGVEYHDRVFQFASFSFDAAVSEIFMALAVGATLCITIQSVMTSPKELSKIINNEKISVITLPPSLLNILEPGDLPGVRILISAGEACPKEVGRKWCQGRKMFNAYGPTETTIGPTYYPVMNISEDSKTIPIGKPIQNMKVYVLDGNQIPLPIGIPGELYIGGVGVGREYLNRKELTAEKFLPNPFIKGHNSRIYRTGDRVRWLRDGNLEFLGRMDEQVKIRGLRIELGEIESDISLYPGISQSVVIVREKLTIGKQLVGFIKASDKEKIDISHLRSFLKDKLPDYMVPSAYIFLDNFPLTPNGKIDKKALILLSDKNEQLQLSNQFESPRTPEEEIIVDVYSEVLGIERIGIRDNFFELGGHSLLATQVISRLSNIFEIEIPLRMIFEFPEPAILSSQIKELNSSSFANKTISIKPQKRTFDNNANIVSPLSFAQQRLWFLEQFDPDNRSYNLPVSVRINGELDYNALLESINFLVKRHESLRTKFVTSLDGVGEQIVLPELNLPLEKISMEQFPLNSREAEARKLVQILIQNSFNLSEGPLIRFYVLTLTPNENVLLITMHHIISDGWSLNILVQELFDFYFAFHKQDLDYLENYPSLLIQYVDFSIWQREWFSDQRLEAEFLYWEVKLKDLPPFLNLPIDRTRPAMQTFSGKTIGFEIPALTSEKVHSYSIQIGVTPFMTLMSVFELLLFRYTGQEDFAIGTPIANRNYVELEGLIGFFVNTLIIRSDIPNTKSFSELVNYVRDTLLGAFSHQEIPFEMLVDRLQVDRNISHSPVFQVVFTMQSNPQVNNLTASKELFIQSFEADLAISKYDLTFSIFDSQERITGSIEYNTSLFDDYRIQLMAGHFLNLIEDVLSRPNEKLRQYNLLTIEEKQKILLEWTNTDLVLPNNLCTHHLFELNASNNPEHPAIFFNGISLSYQYLNHKANILANYLLDLGVSENIVVGVCLDKSPEVIISILAIMKAGGIYLPLDPNLPSERLEFVINDCLNWMGDIPLQIITTSDLLGIFPRRRINFFCFDIDWELLESSDEVPFTGNTNLDINLEQSAYIIYTSGSTGKPKGVALRHLGLRNMVEAYIRGFELTKDDRILQFASLSFDASLMEIFSALASGGTLYITAKDILLSPMEMMSYLKDNNISMCILPPSLLRILPPDELPSLRILISAGESCSIDIARIWSKGRSFVNGYGPTETTIGPTYYMTSDFEGTMNSLPIGKPIQNMKIYVLDEELQPVPIGIPGELFISGMGLAKEYLNQPELTQQRFIEIPWIPGSRFYRTGDLGKWLPDGNLDFIGRVDYQVKVRGFRIELGEIESVLETHPLIKQAIVMVREDLPGQKRLVAYIQISEDIQKFEIDKTKEHLSKSLPEYMIPSVFVLIDQFQLTSSGKVDRKLLPLPEMDSNNSDRPLILPETEDEKRLANIWKTLLGIDQISVADNFFELGGDSILSIQMIARANAAGIIISPRQLFQNPSIRELLKVAGSEDSVSEQGLVVGRIELTPILLRFFENHPTSINHWNTSIMLTVFMDLDMELLEKAVKFLMQHHDILRSKFRMVNGKWNMLILDEIDLSCLSIIDLSRNRSAERELEIESACDIIQTSLDLVNGPLFRIAKLHLGDDEPSRLLFTFHHTVFDGVSWRIFINDFQVVCNQLLNGVEPKLLPKTTSYKEWSEKLLIYSQSDDVNNEYEYWKNLAGKHIRIPVDYENGSNTYGEALTIDFSLTESETNLLIREIPNYYKVKVDEILIAIFTKVMTSWIGENFLVLELFGHGRENIIPGVDLSRTIGWFTTAYPVHINVDWEETYDSLISSVKNQLRQIKYNGIHYGLLRYLNENIDIHDEMNLMPIPEINFNYLGQFDQIGMDQAENQILAIPASESRGREQDPNGQRESRLYIVASVTGGQMQWYWSYSPGLHKLATIEILSKALLTEIRRLLDNYLLLKG